MYIWHRQCVLRIESFLVSKIFLLAQQGQLEKLSNLVKAHKKFMKNTQAHHGPNSRMTIYCSSLEIILMSNCSSKTPKAA